MAGMPPVTEIAAVPGLRIVKRCLKNVRGLEWLHSLLDKAKWKRSSQLQQASYTDQVELVQATETGEVSFADLNTIEPEVFAQLLSSAAFYLPEESEMLRCLRIGKTTQPLHFHSQRIRNINAALLLGRSTTTTTLVHRHSSGAFSHPIELSTGDLLMRRGKAAAEWDMLVSPTAPPSGSSAPVSTRHLVLFTCFGEWPDQEFQ